jgi:hypothetical protein
MYLFCFLVQGLPSPKAPPASSSRGRCCSGLARRSQQIAEWLAEYGFKAFADVRFDVRLVCALSFQHRNPALIAADLFSKLLLR